MDLFTKLLPFVMILFTGCSVNNLDVSNEAIIHEIKPYQMSVLDANYIGKSSLKIDNETPEFYYNEKFSLQVQTPITLKEFANILVKSYPKVSINFSESIRESNQAMFFNFRGTLKEGLDHASNLYDVFFSTEEHAITIENKKLFTEYLDFSGYTEGGFSMAAGVVKDSQGSFQSTANFGQSGNFWSELNSVFELLLPEGGYSISEMNGTVSYLASYRKHKTIDDFLQALKEQKNMQLKVNYKVISVSDTIAQKLGIGMSLGIERGSGNTTITSPEVTLLDYISYQDKNVELLLELGHEEGKLKTIQEGVFLVRNGHSVPINLLTNTEYISEISIETNDFSQTQSVTTEELSTGLSINLKPNLLSNGSVELVSAFSKSELVSMQSVSGVMLPTTTEVETFSRALMIPGEFVVVSSFNTNTDEASSTFKTTQYTDTSGTDFSRIVVIANVTYD